MRGGSSSSRSRTRRMLQEEQTTTRLQDDPRTSQEDNADFEEEEAVDLHHDQQPEDNNLPQAQEQPQEELDLRGRLRVTVVGDCLHPSEKCSRKIYKIFQLKVDEQGVNFKSVSSQTKKFYFEEFKKYFVWDAAIHTLVENAFYKKAKERYSNFIYDIKIKPKPSYIPQVVWDELERLWNSPEFRGRSERNSKNRRCGKENGPAPSTHVCGSVTHATTEKRLEEKTQKRPTAYQLFLHGHTLGHDGERFISDKSKDVNDKVLALMEKRREEGVQNIDEDQVFFEAVGGRKRKRVFALGQAVHIHYPEASSKSFINQKDIDDRVTQKVSDLCPTLESEIRESITAEIRSEIREEITAEISKSFEDKFVEQKREIQEMKAMMTKLLGRSQL